MDNHSIVTRHRLVVPEDWRLQSKDQQELYPQHRPIQVLIFFSVSRFGLGFCIVEIRLRSVIGFASKPSRKTVQRNSRNSVHTIPWACAPVSLRPSHCGPERQRSTKAQQAAHRALPFTPRHQSSPTTHVPVRRRGCVQAASGAPAAPPPRVADELRAAAHGRGTAHSQGPS